MNLRTPKQKTLSKDACTLGEHRFKTSDGHHGLYVQEWGNPAGVPVLFLHGGPGAGCNDKHKLLFNPEKHRVVFLDQRGSGRTTPFGSLTANTTQKLIEDIELVRSKLKITKWHVHGTSWGSTLGLCYAAAHQKNILSMIIGGIWLGSEEEVNWLINGGYAMFYPDAWARFQKLNHPAKEIDPYAFSSAFLQFYRLDGRYIPIERESYDDTPLKIEFKYLQNKLFLPDNYILDNAAKLNLPIKIVQGRYDIVTPPKFAWRLHQELPNSEIFWTVAGHSASDRANYDVTRALLSSISQ